MSKASNYIALFTQNSQLQYIIQYQAMKKLLYKLDLSQRSFTLTWHWVCTDTDILARYELLLTEAAVRLEVEHRQAVAELRSQLLALQERLREVEAAREALASQHHSSSQQHSHTLTSLEKVSHSHIESCIPLASTVLACMYTMVVPVLLYCVLW